MMKQGRRKRRTKQRGKSVEIYEGQDTVCPCGNKDLSIFDYNTSDKTGFLFCFTYKCKCGQLIKYYTSFISKKEI